jgi:putative tryptophan/tyrosine transport system substrate-binding protein
MAIRIRRRELIVTLGSAAAAWPLAARGQQPKTTMGILDPGVPHMFAAFIEGMRELGYVEGQNITYVRRSAAGNPQIVPQLAAELVALKVDIIVTGATLPIRAVKSATSTIPIVFVTGDAVTTGIVSNLPRPGGNLTGLSFLNDDLSSKRLDVLRDAMPQLQSVAVFDDPSTTRKYLEVTEETGRRLGLKLQVFELPSVESFEQAFATAKTQRLQAVDVLASAFFDANHGLFAELALKYKLPGIYEHGEFVRAGCLLSYGPNVADLFKRAAIHADKIIKGARPGDLPVEQPTKFEMLINLKTAKAIGVRLSDSFLLRADEIIE